MYFQAVSAKLDAGSQNRDSAEEKLLRTEILKTLEDADNKMKKKEDEILTLRNEYESKVNK